MKPSLSLPVACAISRSYVLPLAVMLRSLREHLDPSFEPVLYLIHAGIPAASLGVISSIIKTHSIVPSESQLAAAPCDTHFPREASIPLLLADLVPAGVERILFLDADMLVLEDLAKLWQTPLDGHVLAAAPDAAIPLCSSPRGVKGWRARGIPSHARYFNCGVLMIDLELWRQRDVTRRALQYLQTTRERIDFLHQEALNAVLWNAWEPLDSRWNLLASHARRSYESSAAESWRKPGIVHFAGRVKPWRAPVGGPFNSPYRKVMEPLRPLVPVARPALRDTLYSVYDRYLRSAFFPLERYFWKRRLL